jgi:hypothetical protein
VEKRKELNLGYSDFKSIIQNNNYFVDKSLLIKDVIKAEKAVLLIPRPRRFGKTLNLSMLKYFFEINQPENEKLFEHLKINQVENDIKLRQGKYPVIYLSFKDSKHDTWIDTLTHIKIEIARIFREQNYLLDGNILSEIEKNEYKKISDRSADNVDFEVSIQQLSEYLFRFHHAQVVILIDEYDTPIQASYKKFYDEAISFMRNLLSGAYKDNKYLYKGVITGILRVSRESIFTGLNNISVFSILEDELSDNFGFTEEEVMRILQDFNVPTQFEQIKTWYNGYKFGNTSDIYNPWSILNFALSYKSGFKPFWVNTSSDELIKECLKERDANYTREQLLKLINNETIEKSIDENFVFPDLDTDKELLWTLLTFSGYLTVESKLDYNTFNLKIPNYEIKLVFKNIIKKWLNVDIKIKQTLLINTTKYLISKDLENFEKGFKEIIGDTFSYFDTKGEPENVYQSYVLGLLAIIGDDYIIKSNRESGEGRYDIMLIPRDKNKTGVVIEIKQMTRNENETDDKFHTRINSKIKEALNQIKTNKYYKELLDNKVTDILELPIVFAGKEPYISLINKEKE